MTASVPPSVAIIEDDQQVRRALERLLTTVGYDVRTFSSAEDFVAGLSVSVPACLVLDAHLPKMDGLALFEWLRRAPWGNPADPTWQPLPKLQPRPVPLPAPQPVGGAPVAGKVPPWGAPLPFWAVPKPQRAPAPRAPRVPPPTVAPRTP